MAASILEYLKNLPVFGALLWLTWHLIGIIHFCFAKISEQRRRRLQHRELLRLQHRQLLRLQCAAQHSKLQREIQSEDHIYKRIGSGRLLPPARPPSFWQNEEKVTCTGAYPTFGRSARKTIITALHIGIREIISDDFVYSYTYAG